MPPIDISPQKPGRESATLMFSEASQASAVVAAQLKWNAAQTKVIAERLRSQPPRAVVTCARGSSDHAATYAKYMIETYLGVLTSSASPSVSSVYGARQDLNGVLYLAISQSGKSPDLLAAVQAAKAAGAFTVALVNDEDSPLAKLAEAVLPLQAGPERSVAATKSYIGALAAIAQLTAAWSQDSVLIRAIEALPSALSTAWSLDWDPARESLVAARGLYVLGRGVGLAAAQEAALKFKETCGLHAEAFSTAEVLHGPMALVGKDFPVLIFAQDDETLLGVEAMARDIAGRGADVLMTRSAVGSGIRLPTLEAHPALQPLLMIQSFYRMANGLSLARGFDPDHPPHLKKVTETV